MVHFPDQQLWALPLGSSRMTHFDALLPNESSRDLRIRPDQFGAVELKMGIVRCPYCVDGKNFRALRAASESRYFCEQCGHEVATGEPGFRCECKKCEGYRQHLPAPRSKESMRNC
jgi:hypothetical protein